MVVVIILGQRGQALSDLDDKAHLDDGPKDARLVLGEPLGLAQLGRTGGEAGHPINVAGTALQHSDTGRRFYGGGPFQLEFGADAQAMRSDHCLQSD